MVPIGLQALEWSIAQMKREPIPSAPTKRLWFQPCVRKGKLLGLTAGNHCAAAACAAVRACSPTGQIFWLERRDLSDGRPEIQRLSVPHDYRASAKELMTDAKLLDAWLPKAERPSPQALPYAHSVARGDRPQPGDLAIYDRSVPGRPETDWWGHVDRVVSVLEQGYRNLGANEGAGGAWRLQLTAWDHPKLLGFVRYTYPEELDQEGVRALERVTAWALGGVQPVALAARADLDGPLEPLV